MDEKKLVTMCLGEYTFDIGEYAYQEYSWGAVVCGNADRSNPQADVGVYVVYIFHGEDMFGGFCVERWGTNVSMISDSAFMINGEIVKDDNLHVLNHGTPWQPCECAYCFSDLSDDDYDMAFYQETGTCPYCHKNIFKTITF